MRCLKTQRKSLTFSTPWCNHTYSKLYEWRVMHISDTHNTFPLLCSCNNILIGLNRVFGVQPPIFQSVLNIWTTPCLVFIDRPLKVVEKDNPAVKKRRFLWEFTVYEFFMLPAKKKKKKFSNQYSKRKHHCTHRSSRQNNGVIAFLFRKTIAFEYIWYICRFVAL